MTMRDEGKLRDPTQQTRGNPVWNYNMSAVNAKKRRQNYVLTSCRLTRAKQRDGKVKPSRHGTADGIPCTWKCRPKSESCSFRRGHRVGFALKSHSYLCRESGEEETKDNNLISKKELTPKLFSALGSKAMKTVVSKISRTESWDQQHRWAT